MSGSTRSILAGVWFFVSSFLLNIYIYSRRPLVVCPQSSVVTHLSNTCTTRVKGYTFKQTANKMCIIYHQINPTSRMSRRHVQDWTHPSLGMDGTTQHRDTSWMQPQVEIGFIHAPASLGHGSIHGAPVWVHPPFLDRTTSRGHGSIHRRPTPGPG